MQALVHRQAEAEAGRLTRQLEQLNRSIHDVLADSTPCHMSIHGSIWAQSFWQQF